METRQNFVLTKEEKATDNGARQRLAIKDVGFRRRRDSLTARTCSSVQPCEKTKPFLQNCGAVLALSVCFFAFTETGFGEFFQADKI